MNWGFFGLEDRKLEAHKLATFEFLKSNEKRTQCKLLDGLELDHWNLEGN